jgi:glutaredoxin
MKKFLPWIIVILVIVGLFYWSAALKAVPAGKYDDFAKCLADKKFTMYGAYWCPHCKKQKALFGDSFKFVPYVECTESAAVCEAKGVRGYPTWIDESNASSTQKYEGELEFSKISEITSCPLPAQE